jgi:hypothetical protein
MDAAPLNPRAAFPLLSFPLPRPSPPPQCPYPTTTPVDADMRIRWLAKALLDGALLPALAPLAARLSAPSVLVPRRAPHRRVALLVGALTRVCALAAGPPGAPPLPPGVALARAWAQEPRLLVAEVKGWLPEDAHADCDGLWLPAVRAFVAAHSRG